MKNYTKTKIEETEPGLVVLLLHLARKQSGSILTTRSVHAADWLKENVYMSPNQWYQSN